MTHTGLRTRRGFSLPEILVVMFMIVLVGSMSLGKMHSIMNQADIGRAAASARTNIELAFTMAVRSRQPVHVSWDATNMQLDVTNRAGTTVYRRADFGDAFGLKASSVTFSRTALEVYPNGLANDTLLITLSKDSVTKTIRVSRAGLVQTQ